jgi:hypothetical protein
VQSKDFREAAVAGEHVLALEAALALIVTMATTNRADRNL